MVAIPVNHADVTDGTDQQREDETNIKKYEDSLTTTKDKYNNTAQASEEKVASTGIGNNCTLPSCR